MFRDITGRLAQLRLYSLLPRSHPQNILNASLFDLIERPLRSRGKDLLVNHFLQSVLLNDLTRSRMLLRRLGQRSEKLETQDKSGYYSCLSILLSHLAAKKTHLSIYDVKLLIEEVRFKQLNGFQGEIAKKFVLCLLYSYLGVVQKPLKASIASYIRSQLRGWRVQEIEIVLAAAEEDNGKQLVEAFGEIMNSNFRVKPKREKAENMPIEDYKSEGFLSFDGMCKFIARRFTAFDRSSRLPMYELYLELNDKDKIEFMQAYLEYNKEKQLQIEFDCLDLVGDFRGARESKIANINRFKRTHANIIYPWYEKNLACLKDMLSQMKTSSFAKSNEVGLSKYGLCLELLPKDLFTSLVISTLLSKTLTSESGYVSVLDLTRSLGFTFKRLMMKEPTYKDFRRYYMEFFEEEDTVQFFVSLLHRFINNCTIPKSLTKRGTFQKAMDLLDESRDIDQRFLSHRGEECPAVLWGFQHKSGTPHYKRFGVFKIHPYLLFAFNGYESLFTKSVYPPMLCPPKPWSAPTDGGYLRDLKPFVNTEDMETSLFYFNRAHETGQLNSTYQALDILSSNAWAINRDILNVFNEVIRKDWDFLKIPSSKFEFDYDFPEQRPRADFPNTSDYTEYLKIYKSDRREKQQQLYARKSLRSQVETLNKLANALNENGDIFYFPYQVDFRGRAYPMVSTLSHYQDDLSRSLLQFWFTKPLGKNGMSWIKYQLAGLYGEDKLTMEDRIRFVDSNFENIVNSADYPLSGDMWWCRAEKPWQTLSLCIELNKIIKYTEKGHDSANYYCRIPIHQDGSCNGLQHYAALGADEEGGLSVNLISSTNKPDLRQDVYTTVLELVKRQVLIDARNTNHPKHKLAAISLQILSRKVLKQTIMTSVYGVTRYGATLQISERIKELLDKSALSMRERKEPSLSLADYNTIQKSRLEISTYLASQVLSSIGELFSGARHIQHYLVDNCSRIINSFDLDSMDMQQKISKKDPNFFHGNKTKPMMWTTVSGFPVVQLYRRVKQMAIPTSLQSVVINKPQKFATIDTQRQLNGIAPNFIHSLDSMHMLMTCVASNQMNIPFVSVHDSFWTLPPDVDRLSELIRKEFVRLHTSNILENLREDMIYTTRKSFQMVFFDEKENKDFLRELRTLRELYSNSGLGTAKNFNRVLFHELKIQTENGTTETPLALVAKYKPSLYYRNTTSGKFLKLYEDTTISATEIPLTKKLKPLLVPVKILEVPPTGTLDITEVLESKYFFS